MTESLTAAADPHFHSEAALKRLADKWKVNIILSLSAGSLRFGQLRRQLTGISQKVLTASLRSMELDGLVQRTVYQEVPPRVEYALTEAGQMLLPILKQLAQWNERFFSAQESAEAS